MGNWIINSSSLPNSWGSVPGPAGAAGRASTAANQEVMNNFAANANGLVSGLSGGLNAAVGNLYGTNRANNRAIDRSFAKQGGAALSQLVSSGLGNSTIRQSINTGLTRAHADALSESRAAFGEKLFNAQAMAAQAPASMGASLLSTLFNGTNIGFPDPSSAFSSMYGGGAGGGGGGGMIDPSRPTGGPLPAWAFYGGGGVDPGVSGGSWGTTSPGNSYIPTTYEAGLQARSALGPPDLSSAFGAVGGGPLAALYATGAFAGPSQTQLGQFVPPPGYGQAGGNNGGGGDF